MNLSAIKRAAVGAALAIISFIGAGRLASRSVNGQETKPRALHGAAALDQLKQEGQYESLQAAMNQARFSVSLADATPLGRSAWHAPNRSAGYDAYVTVEGVSIAVNDKWYVSLNLNSTGRAVAVGFAGQQRLARGGQR